ncbi:hypothetical protein BOX17_13785 [Halomonas aestuarii]|uniref:DUF2333 domain-containing protein n=1 Tax=Halomonas aestuarii TaxID=1897729 RepID=A0A1J0VIR6_9GAMM|nr:DUF2333 family protein [Halomonas aestuarii]APE31928.1 hypothetical protein BOX17_13785 [Halomonas aestuarii]
MALTQKGAARRRRRTEELERPDYGWIWKPLLTLLVLYLAVCVGLGVWWSRTPAAFDVEQAVAEQRGASSGSPASRGAVTTASLMTLVETLLEKPGGYLRNDVAPPGVWLDNMPAWELGVLTQARQLSRVLPAMEQSSAPALAEVQQRLAGDSRDWLYPSTEKRLNQALVALDGYLQALGEDGEAAFGDQGQGLSTWVEAVTRSLDDLGLRLSASIGSREELRDLDIDAEALPTRTAWYRVDDVFFEARGQAWALMHLLQAVQRDQADVLASAGLTARWERLVVELEMSERRLWSPMVLNGSGFGIFANHSLVMANYMVRARDLAGALAEGLAEVSSPAPDSATEAAVTAEQDGGDAAASDVTTESAVQAEQDVGEATVPDAGTEAAGQTEQDGSEAPAPDASTEAAVQPEQDGGDAASPAAAEPAAEDGGAPEEAQAPSGGAEEASSADASSQGAGNEAAGADETAALPAEEEGDAAGQQEVSEQASESSEEPQADDAATQAGEEGAPGDAASAEAPKG